MVWSRASWKNVVNVFKDNIFLCLIRWHWLWIYLWGWFRLDQFLLCLEYLKNLPRLWLLHQRVPYIIAYISASLLWSLRTRWLPSLRIVYLLQLIKLAHLGQPILARLNRLWNVSGCLASLFFQRFLQTRMRKVMLDLMRRCYISLYWFIIISERWSLLQLSMIVRREPSFHFRLLVTWWWFHILKYISVKVVLSLITWTSINFLSTSTWALSW